MYETHRSSLQILRRQDVEARLRLSRATIYERINPKSQRYEASFPKPIRLGGGAAVGWLAHEVDDYILARIEASRGVSR